MKPTNRLVRSAHLIVAPVVLAAKVAGAVTGRAASVLKGFGPQSAEPTPAPVPDPEVPAFFPSELPIAAYDALNVRDASTAIKTLEDVEQVRVMLRYEEQNAKRTGVHRAARLRLTALEG